MDIVKLIGVALIALVIILILKQYKPEFVLYVELVAGIIILSMAFEQLEQILEYYKKSKRISEHSSYWKWRY